MHHPSRRILAHRATALVAPTTTESLLWGALRGSQLGVGFRRQFLIGKYRVDFAAPRVRLVVEIDGAYHRLRQRADARRDRDLGRLGWRVLRLPADLVLHRHDAAVALVRAAVDGDR